MTSSNDQSWISVLQSKSNDLPQMTSGDLQTFSEGPVLSFHNICYGVKEKSHFLLFWKTNEKKVLSNINGIMKPGLNAIMGPSGAGKSSLLDVLAARKDPRGLSGKVLINGAPLPTSFPRNSGYVAKGDAVMVTLTVRENLEFSAALRLPTVTDHERKERINKVIQELGLSTVADSKVSSSGERKRTSIAMELIMDPSILFLDEPTTGLDSSTASAIVLFLKRMSQQGRTIIFTIHQPRYFIFKLFDSLTLLASGKLMFHGPAQEALGYFESAGYQYEPYNNPAYFFLDNIKRDSSTVVLNRKEDDCEANRAEQFSKTEESVRGTLAEFYANSSFYRDTEARLQELSDGQKRSSAFEEVADVTSFCHQFRWNLWRAFKNSLGFPFITLLQLFATVILGLIVGATFLVLKNDCTEIQNRAWALYVLIAFQCFSSVTAGEIFELQKKLFKHEYVSGYYRVLPYFFGELLSELLPRRFLPSVLFNFILYFMLRLKLDVEAFFMLMSIVLLVAYATSSMALVLGAGEKAMDMKTFLVNLYFVFMMVFLGMSLNFGTTIPWLSWFEYFSIPHYGYMALQHNEFLGRNFCPGLSTTESSGCTSYVICTGEEFLTIQGIDLSPWGLWKNLLSLTCMILVFLTVTYLKLVFLKKYS
ncbi:broad substrate specificity ATP-binding cassette transporter ABCG2-like [Sciurus carolinensis]|uniref:broad substrate specificity ATP-binding cassette transporter ABCG2-like n=1 Tax=Sciurus carolinensis TaxID=30640 RepID=UPI001FB3CD39|nr:broad substrate specificity ATP-binding cassette transporter ABCG2-like [Sciurus carolinensis]